jgi:DNA-binding transcriptional regulator YbjK
MGIAERKEKQKAEIRKMILDASMKLFVEEGFENVSIRKIADLIEYSPTTVYLYFTYTSILKTRTRSFSACTKWAFRKWQNIM